MVHEAHGWEAEQALSRLSRGPGLTEGRLWGESVLTALPWVQKLRGQVGRDDANVILTRIDYLARQFPDDPGRPQSVAFRAEMGLAPEVTRADSLDGRRADLATELGGVSVRTIKRWAEPVRRFVAHGLLQPPSGDEMQNWSVMTDQRFPTWGRVHLYEARLQLDGKGRVVEQRDRFEIESWVPQLTQVTTFIGYTDTSGAVRRPATVDIEGGLIGQQEISENDYLRLAVELPRSLAVGESHTYIVTRAYNVRHPPEGILAASPIFPIPEVVMRLRFPPDLSVTAMGRHEVGKSIIPKTGLAQDYDLGAKPGMSLGELLTAQVPGEIEFRTSVKDPAYTTVLQWRID